MKRLDDFKHRWKGQGCSRTAVGLTVIGFTYSAVEPLEEPCIF